MSRIVRRAQSVTNVRAVWSISTWFTRSSNARYSRESSDTATMPPMKQAAIFTPSGRSATFAIVV
jgi:hypothetical protein